MLRVRIPKYRKHKPSKLAVVSLGGRDIYLGKYGTKESRDEYDRLVAEYLKRRSYRRSTQARCKRRGGSEKDRIARICNRITRQSLQQVIAA